MRDIRETARIGAWAAWWATVVVGSGAIVLWSGEAYPHEAPTGWSYPFNCCSGVDCRAVVPALIHEGQAGYTIVPTGEVIPMTDARIKPSPDGEYHWCSVAGRDDSRTICLFVPGRGS